MVFSVRYRKPDGTLDHIEVEAESRSAVFPILEKRGVSPVKIDEANLKACGWNRQAKNHNAFAGGGFNHSTSFKFVFVLVPIVVLAVGGIFWFCNTLSSATSDKEKSFEKKIKEVDVETDVASKSEETYNDKVKRIRNEMNDQVKEFVKKSPTNKIEWVVAPLDPDDPDNALRTSIARDIGTLLSVRPGETIPPCIPFSFMFEDDAIAAAAARGESVLTVDGGNKKFLEDLRKWKVTIKEGDSEARVKAKNELVDAQLELLKGIDEGVSVNDSIRAAYQYRVEAARRRTALMDSIREIHKEDPDVGVTRGLIEKVNEQLNEEGIIPIEEESVIPEEDLIAADGEEENNVNNDITEEY